eukprot:CAMPEP_0178944038 /NCGR_PEP_ID=MMETSP0789-20121207/2920_1 /TAXON_ID=3005 /ORGANISM="Rhizosolenia setigera, Strain CCMP 1694" /LENGTH=505 /DNA_ID=CAMNT_0020623699 /DNA_START=294 /DNA_END=1811 /DNA_ORIENTATION=+
MSFIAANLKDNFGVGEINESTTVALYCPNHVDFVPICLATALIGVKLTPINPLFKKDELTTILDRSQSKVLICHHTTLETALESMKQSKTVEHLIVIPKYDDDEGTVPVEGTHNFVSSLKKKHKNPIFETDPKVLLQDLALYPHLLPYSSGTTGTPKGVCLSHTNLVANLMQIEAVEKVGFPPNHKLICPLPFFHIYGCVVSALYTAWQGQELITMSGRFDLGLFSQLVEKHQPHRAHLVPPILIQLAKSPIVDKYDLSSISMIWSSAAPLSKETAEAVTNRIGCNIKQAWGMSELSPLGTLNSDSNSRQGAIGQLIPSTSGKVVDPKTNENLGPGQTGELMIKGPQVMMGYWNDPVKTSETISSDGWLKTGDVAKYDKDGFFYITDRLKELIKVRGFQVAPAELEALLLTHPSISDAAVIPIDDEYSGELPRAYISLVKQKEQEESSQRLTEMDVQKWVKERVAPYKRLEGGVEFIDVVPKSPSGKILRRLLKDKYRCEMMKKE